MPKRIVVELDAADYEALEVACHNRRVTAPLLIRLVALRLVRAL